MTYQVNKLGYSNRAPYQFAKASSIKFPQASSIKFPKTSSIKFAKTQYGNPYLISMLAFTFGLVLTLILLGARLVSSLFPSRKYEDGFDN